MSLFTSVWEPEKPATKMKNSQFSGIREIYGFSNIQSLQWNIFGYKICYNIRYYLYKSIKKGEVFFLNGILGEMQ